MGLSVTTKRKFISLCKPFIQNYVPRWIIFSIDLLHALVAAQATFLLISSVTVSNYSFFNFSWQMWAIVGVQGLYFILFRSYSGLVRYSSFKDVIKQLKVTTSCIITLLIINQIYYFTFEQKLILNAGVIIFGFITFSFLFFFRVIIKHIYQLINTSRSKAGAYILGTDRKDVAMAEGLISENSDRFSIVGFVDEHQKPMNNRIFNLPIYNIKQIERNSAKNYAVIVSDEKLKHLRNNKSDILARLLDLKIKVFKLPKLQDWDAQTSFGALKEIKIEDLLQRSPIKLNNQKLKQLYKGKTILVTGAAGSIGSEIVRQLIPFKPAKILLLDQAETPLHEFSLELNKDYPLLNYEKVIANVRSKKRLKKVFKKFKPEVIFHGAAYKHVPMMECNSIEALSVNFRGTRNLANFAVRYKIERFVFVSTDKAVNPTNIMGASKRSAELYIQYLASQKNKISTTFITTRFGNVLGSNGSVIPHFKKQIANNGPVTVTHPEITRYFMTIDEACQLVLEAGAMGNGGEIYVFDMGSPIKIIDLAKHMIRLTGLIPNEDIPIEFTGLRPGEKLYEELLADKETTLPTHHEKIMIVKTAQNFNDFKVKRLQDLFRYIKKGNANEAISCLKMLVPEYDPIAIESKKNKAVATQVLSSSE